MIFKTVLSLGYVSACHSTTHIFSVLACLSPYYTSSFPPIAVLAIALNNFHSYGMWRFLFFFFNVGQFVTARYVSLCFFLSLCLPPLSFLLFAMLAGPNLPADISILWHSANWQHCRRERKREGENERKLVNNRRRERGRESERE